MGRPSPRSSSASLDNLEEIETIAVSVLRKDGTVTAGCSNTTKADWALLVLAIDEHRRRGFGDSG